MKKILPVLLVIIASALAVLVGSAGSAQDKQDKQDKYTLKVPATLAGKPPQGNDAKCGAACHTLAASKDYIFTPYPKR